jgi:hypothetical protein
MEKVPGAAAPAKGGARAKLIRLVYLSMRTRDLTAEDVDQIEGRSEANNLAAGITGLLIAQGQYFYGVMEGPRRPVMQRMEVVITDDRHMGLRILREEEIVARRFANWSFARLPDETTTRSFGMPLPGSFILELSRRLA